MLTSDAGESLVQFVGELAQRELRERRSQDGTSLSLRRQTASAKSLRRRRLLAPASGKRAAAVARPPRSRRRSGLPPSTASTFAFRVALYGLVSSVSDVATIDRVLESRGTRANPFELSRIIQSLEETRLDHFLNSMRNPPILSLDAAERPLSTGTVRLKIPLNFERNSVEF